MKIITPKIRDKNIVVQNLKNEILIYDLAIDKAYCLNETAAAIYQNCDGVTTFDELRRKSRKDISDEVIWLAIEELSKQNLLAEKMESGVSRRSLLQKAAFSAVVLPLISMIIAPRAAQAQSGGNCLADGTPMGVTTNFSDYFCSYDPDEPPEPPCCSNMANVNFDNCTAPDNQGIVTCGCVCGPQIGE